MQYIGAVDITGDFLSFAESVNNTRASSSYVKKEADPSYMLLCEQAQAIQKSITELSGKANDLSQRWDALRKLMSQTEADTLLMGSRLTQTGLLRVLSNIDLLAQDQPSLVAENGIQALIRHTILQALRLRVQTIYSTLSEISISALGFKRNIPLEQPEGLPLLEEDSEQEQLPNVPNVSSVADFYGIEAPQAHILTEHSLERSLAMLQDSKRIEETTAELHDMSVTALTHIQEQGQLIDHVYQAALETEMNTDTGCMLIERATLRVRSATNRAVIILLIAIFSLIYVDLRH